ncbi:uncharacterized protein BJX67DRAFT_376007 [Aspergillus lucknowensis]|uniref:Uncharacterized protein n=1 Tax=Aspergillus lucknowensis TaxID=176173 RepID=A0ABR4L5L9_9EURO
MKSRFSPPSTLPLPRHQLPARPLAEVCVLVKKPEHGMASPCNLAPYILALDLIPCHDPQANTSIPTKPPIFRGDYAENDLLSPSILSSGNSLEKLFMLPDKQDDIPINLDINLHLLIPQDNSLNNLETTCLYPNPPATLRSLLNHYQDASKRDVGEDTSTRTSNYNRQKVHYSPHEGQARKQYQACSTLPPSKDSSIALHSHFMSLLLNKRSSRKGMPWSAGKVDLLLKLRKDGKRPWSEVTREFSKHYLLIMYELEKRALIISSTNV